LKWLANILMMPSQTQQRRVSTGRNPFSDPSVENNSAICNLKSEIPLRASGEPVMALGLGNSILANLVE
jgi:hypothetical protein